MGILDMLLKLDARRQGAVLDDQEARVRRQQTEQGVGLAKQLYRSGKRDDPAAQQAVGLMSDPGSRALGVQQAANVLDPAYQQGQQLGALQIEGQQGSNRVGALREAFIPQEQQFARDQAGYLASQDRRAEASLGLQQDQLRLQREQLKAAQQPDPYGGLKPDVWLAKGEETRSIAQGVGAARGMAKILTEYGNLGKLASSDAQARLQVGMFTMIPALQKSLNSGGQNALGTEEREWLTAFLGNPADFVTRPGVTTQKLLAIADKLQGDLDYRVTAYPAFAPGTYNIPNYELPPNLVPLSAQQQGPGFYEQIGSGAINPGFGVPR